MVTQSLEEAGVSTEFFIRDKERHTGTVVVLVDSEGQNAKHTGLQGEPAPL
jgi:sugar/nucleoside kinase (ribokinase family)